jgi:LSD1 subclass zinc finger protein
MLLHCANCRTPLTIPESLAGKSVRCPKCQATFLVSAEPIPVAAPAQDPIERLFPRQEPTTPSFGLDLPSNDAVRARVDSLMRHGRKRTWAFVGASLSGALSLLVLMAGILGVIHFQSAILYILGGTLLSSLVLGAVLFRLIHSGFFPAALWSSWKFHVAAVTTILGVGIAAGLILYLSRLWTQFATQIQVILGVSLLAGIAGALVGWYAAWILYES